MCSRQIDTISVNPVINVYSVAILEYNMAVFHHYGCHTPLNQIWSNIYIYMYFILIQITQYSQTNGSSNTKVYTCVIVIAMVGILFLLKDKW